MRAIPLHIQRRFEQRWAARFVSPVASAAPKSTDSKGVAMASEQLSADRVDNPLRPAMGVGIVPQAGALIATTQT